MDNSLATGLMAVLAVSGSVVFVALRAHTRLLSDFMEKIECEIGPAKDDAKRKVRFADEKPHPYHKKAMPMVVGGHNPVVDEKLDALPRNWQVLYRGILEYKVLHQHN